MATGHSAYKGLVEFGNMKKITHIYFLIFQLYLKHSLMISLFPYTIRMIKLPLSVPLLKHIDEKLLFLF